MNLGHLFQLYNKPTIPKTSKQVRTLLRKVVVQPTRYSVQYTDHTDLHSIEMLHNGEITLTELVHTDCNV